MQELMGKTMKSFAEGSIVKGRILQKRTNEVLVDIGYKSEGVISLSEFDDSDELEVGSEIEVLLERLENDEGMVVLSKETAAQKQNWEKIVKIFNDGGLISGQGEGRGQGRLDAERGRGGIFARFAGGHHRAEGPACLRGEDALSVKSSS